MGNPEHLALLKQGIEHWNEWRSKNKHIQPGLSAADLSGADLRVAHLGYRQQVCDFLL
jgi:hypothetical protein